jgi:hypothetical protein
MSICHCIHTGLEASPTSFAVCTHGTFCQGNAARLTALLVLVLVVNLEEMDLNASCVS